MIGCAVGTVRSRLHRARGLLVRKLERKAEQCRVYICSQFERELLELARGGSAADERQLDVHLKVCHACRMTLRAQRRLSSAAKALAADVARITPPPGVERALRAEFESMRRGARRRIVFGAACGAIAASLAAWLWIAQRPAPKVVVAGNALPAVTAAAIQPLAGEKPLAKRRRRALPRPPIDAEQPFIAIPYTLPLEPYERAEVMRMDLPVSALIAAGLPMSMMDPVALARADVLVGADGQARAIRLISVSASN